MLANELEAIQKQRVEKARAIIDELRRDNVPLTKRSNRTLKKKDIQTKTDSTHSVAVRGSLLLAEQLAPERLLFELIHNAEDCDYAVVQLQKILPFIHFELLPDRLIVDYNENGFKADNVRAICQMFESTKRSSSVAHDAKRQGIGFRSVLKVAEYVKIQSHPWCFRLHDYGKDGLGTLVPEHDDLEDLSSRVRTRLTIKFRHAQQFAECRQHLLSLPSTSLIFLKNIRSISINICGSGLGAAFDIKHGYCSDEATSTRTITTITDSKSSMQRFFIRKGHRSDSSQATKDKDTDSSDIVLAFPTDDAGCPVLETQHVFAPLPIKNMGFSFLMHANFTTRVNREDIVDNEHNRHIRDDIVSTFIDAMKEFCVDHPLQYQWMHFVPEPETRKDFWTGLRSHLLEQLQTVPLMQYQGDQCLRRIQDVRTLPDDFLDERGEPLVPDLADKLYISSSYPAAAIDELKRLGLGDLTDCECINRVEADALSATSRLKDPASSSGWHEKLAQKLLKVVQAGPETLTKRIKSIPLVQIRGRGDRFVSITDEPVFWSTDGHANIPNDLGFNLVSSQITSESDRGKLYNLLGVTQVPTQIVRSAIAQRCQSSTPVSLDQNIAHLRYLFHQDPDAHFEIDSQIPLFDQEERAVHKPSSFTGEAQLVYGDMYFGSEDPYGACRILDHLGDANAMDDSRVFVHILHPRYTSDVASSDYESWRHWLQKAAGVRNSSSLFDASMKGRAFLLHILESLPEVSICILQAHWRSVEEVVAQNEGLRAAIQQSVVKTENGDLAALQDTFLPTPGLQRLTLKLGIANIFPFLRLDTTLTENDMQIWDFLPRLFNVGIKVDFRFLTQALMYFVDREFLGRQEVGAVVNIYELLYVHTAPSQYRTLRDFFKTSSAVLTNPEHEGEAIWTSPDECLWESPIELTAWHCLAGSPTYQQSSAATELLIKVLHIRSVALEDLLEQLRSMIGSDPTKGEVSAIYTCIDEQITDDESAADIVRDEFHARPMIYDPIHSTWHFRSSCLWSKTSHGTDSVAVHASYGHLENFFVHRLGIQKPSLDMLVEDLIVRSSEPGVSIQTIKTLIHDINGHEPTLLALKPLREVSFVPVRFPSAEVKLCAPSFEFAIADTRELAATFASKVPIVDFKITEVSGLASFFEAMGCEQKLMSEALRTKTNVGEASLDIELTMKLRNRAFALMRCQLLFDKESEYANPDSSHYDCLLNSKVLVSNSITCEGHLLINDRPTAKEAMTGMIHVNDLGSHLEIYLPKLEHAQQESYLQCLPKKLSRLLGMPSTNTSEQIILTVLQIQDLATLDSVLLDEGIVLPCDIEEKAVPQVGAPASPSRFPRLGNSFSSPSSNRNSPSRSPASQQSSRTSVFSTPGSTTTMATSRYTPSPLASKPYLMPPARQLNYGASSPSQLPVKVITEDEHEGYATLLKNLITAAQQSTCRGGPEWWTIDDAEKIFGNDTHDSEMIFGPEQMSHIERDEKVAAAGELFVFELLNKGTPDDLFTIQNWRSRTRHHVSVLEQYGTLKHWRHDAPDTATLVYEDLTGEFSRMLVQKMGRSETEFPGPGEGCVKYFFDVKTTMGDSDEKFWTTRNEYKRMKYMAIQPGKRSTQIYIIFRIFRLGQKDMGMRMIVDPEAYHMEGLLDFKADRFAVTPS